jgi:hypothetical protein
MQNKRSAYEALTGRLEGKRPLGRPKGRCEDNINVDPKEIGLEGLHWIHVDQDNGQIQGISKHHNGFSSWGLFFRYFTSIEVRYKLPPMFI